MMIEFGKIILKVPYYFYLQMYSSQEKIYLSGPEITNLIKKKPFTQIINGVEFTYSILSKIQKSFIMTNDRFLILKGVQSIGYARSLSEKTQLPFRHEGDIPKTKLKYSLSAIQSVSTENEVLKIKFNFDDKAHWEFVCPTKPCALEWRKAIQIAIWKTRNLNNSKYQKYEDYTKESNMKQLQSPPQKEVNTKSKPLTAEKQLKVISLERSTSELKLQGNSSEEKILMKSKSELGVNLEDGVLVKVPDNSQRQIIESGAKTLAQENFKKKKEININDMSNNGNVSDANTQYFSGQQQINSPQKNSSTLNNQFYTSSKNVNLYPAPFTQFSQQKYISNHKLQPKQEMPEELQKIESIIIERSLFESPSQMFLNKSFSTLSMNGKEDVKSEIMSCRREWLEELVSRSEEGQLMIDFQRYSKKIVEVVINELHIPNQNRIFPQRKWNSDFASYIVDDVYVEIYFFTEEQIDQKHKRYQKAVKQFKNYDYFLETTQNQQNVFVPLMAIFQFKGFVGMVKTFVCNESEDYQNQQLFNEINTADIEQQSRVNSAILLDESKCKIVNYRRNHFQSKFMTQYENIYFIDKLDAFLPEEAGSQSNRFNHLLRPELIQDEQFQGKIFGQRERDVSAFEIVSILDRKIMSLVDHLQSQQQYFTNSQELTQLIHSFGLNIRHLGSIYKKITQKWLKVQFKGEIAARSLKPFFRFDMQSCILNQIERINSKEKQSQREVKRAISFLNVVLGSGQSTFRVWRGLNNYSSKHYGSAIWDDTFNDINIGYFLQAIQYHLKIVLDEGIHKKMYFQSNRTFEERDFVRFEPDITIYNLDFTETFEEINECLQEVNMQNFHTLCGIMVKETRLKKTYLQILRGQPIFQKINQYLLNFISPIENIDFYNKLEAAHMPNRFVYQSKLAELRWHLKASKLEGLNRIIDFIEVNGRKWLGLNHPLFVQLNRILAEYYCQNKSFYMKAITLATSSLEMQENLLEPDSEHLWRDYFLLGKIYFTHGHYQNAIPYLARAKKLINIQTESSLDHFSELLICLSKCYIDNGMSRQSYLNARQLFNALKQAKKEFQLDYLLQSVLMIKDLLEKNQEYDTYFRFIDTDFSQITNFFSNDSEMLKKVVRAVFIPHIKSFIFQKSRNRHRALGLMEEIIKITQSSFTCTSYLQQKIRERKFPQSYLQTMKELDSVVDDIYENQLIHKWISFHRMSNETLLQKIGGSQINRGFEFLADISAIFGVFGTEAYGQLSLIQS